VFKVRTRSASPALCDERAPLSRGLALLGLCAACAAAAGTGVGCNDTTFTVGQVATEPQVLAPAAAGRGAVEPMAGSMASEPPTAPSGATSSGSPANTAMPQVPALVADPGVTCEGTVESAVRRRLDLYLMIDSNVTLPVPWTQIAGGLYYYVDHTESQGTGVGVGFFPAPATSTQAMCDGTTYAQPTTPVGLLPGNAAAIKTAATNVQATATFTGSPTKAALEGALTYASSRWYSFHQPQAVVLLTDAVQDFACFTNPMELESTAANAWTGPAAIPTYVIALTVPPIQFAQQLLSVVPLDNLDAVAREGGTGAAHEVNLAASSNISLDLMTQLLAIQHDAEPCDYQVTDAVLSDPSGTVLGTAAATALGATVPNALPRVANEGACGQGYYFDDEANPTWATLCPRTCDAVKAGKRPVLWLSQCVR